MGLGELGCADSVYGMGFLPAKSWHDLPHLSCSQGGVDMTHLISPAHREGSCSREEVLKTGQCSESERLRNQRTGWKFQALDDVAGDM